MKLFYTCLLFAALSGLAVGCTSGAGGGPTPPSPDEFLTPSGTFEAVKDWKEVDVPEVDQELCKEIDGDTPYLPDPRLERGMYTKLMGKSFNSLRGTSSYALDREIIEVERDAQGIQSIKIKNTVKGQLRGKEASGHTIEHCITGGKCETIEISPSLQSTLGDRSETEESCQSAGGAMDPINESSVGRFKLASGASVKARMARHHYSDDYICGGTKKTIEYQNVHIETGEFPKFNTICWGQTSDPFYGNYQTTKRGDLIEVDAFRAEIIEFGKR